MDLKELLKQLVVEEETKRRKAKLNEFKYRLMQIAHHSNLLNDEEFNEFCKLIVLVKELEE